MSTESAARMPSLDTRLARPELHERAPSRAPSWALEVPSKLDAFHWPWATPDRLPQAFVPTSKVEALRRSWTADLAPTPVLHAPETSREIGPAAAPSGAEVRTAPLGDDRRLRAEALAELRPLQPSGGDPVRTLRAGLWVAAAGLALGAAFALLP